jgi:hypothetical protein
VRRLNEGGALPPPPIQNPTPRFLLSFGRHLPGHYYFFLTFSFLFCVVLAPSRDRAPHTAPPKKATTMATPKQASKKRGAAKKSGSQSKKAGLLFPVARIGSQLRRGQYARRVGGSAASVAPPPCTWPPCWST